ncbi:hypothetical protein EDB89DRAFT_2060514 [Lactarius sanguifluus]|nr:hypothetical protein EDB89DRAFT_2060514 [Lactarius sanguifluus]
MASFPTLSSLAQLTASAAMACTTSCLLCRARRKPLCRWGRRSAARARWARPSRSHNQLAGEERLVFVPNIIDSVPRESA